MINKIPCNRHTRTHRDQLTSKFHRKLRRNSALKFQSIPRRWRLEVRFSLCLPDPFCIFHFFITYSRINVIQSALSLFLSFSLSNARTPIPRRIWWFKFQRKTQANQVSTLFQLLKQPRVISIISKVQINNVFNWVWYNHSVFIWWLWEISHPFRIASHRIVNITNGIIKKISLEY